MNFVADLFLARLFFNQYCEIVNKINFMIYCTAMVTNCNGPIFTFVQMDEFKITYKL